MAYDLLRQQRKGSWTDGPHPRRLRFRTLRLAALRPLSALERPYLYCFSMRQPRETSYCLAAFCRSAALMESLSSAEDKHYVCYIRTTTNYCEVGLYVVL